MQAFGEIKPAIIISRAFDYREDYQEERIAQAPDSGMKVLLKLPVISGRIREKIREKLVETFGGNFYEIIIGGAAFNSEVETLLHKIGFPLHGWLRRNRVCTDYYEDWHQFRPGSCGKTVPRMEVKINSTTRKTK